MFTGIIETTGQVAGIQSGNQDSRLRLASGSMSLQDTAPGDSIAVNGVCLTVVARGSSHFEVDVSRETLACTTLGTLKTGSPVNLEKALRLCDRLGGHLVSGHVDGLGELLSRDSEGRSERLVFRVPQELAKYIGAKGSVCIDGVSLTVNAVEADTFTVQVIPHTRQRTIIGNYRPGTRVNIEVDIIARYLERLLQGRVDDSAGNHTLGELLRQQGYL